jgi:hypothetical protein
MYAKGSKRRSIPTNSRKAFARTGPSFRLDIVDVCSASDISVIQSAGYDSMTPLISYMARARETGFQCQAMQNYKLVAKMLSSYICHSLIHSSTNY